MTIPLWYVILLAAATSASVALWAALALTAIAALARKGWP